MMKGSSKEKGKVAVVDRAGEFGQDENRNELRVIHVDQPKVSG